MKALFLNAGRLNNLRKLLPQFLPHSGFDCLVMFLSVGLAKFFLFARLLS